ncbi:MAG: transposase zinc-binding domain-containing protein, partial [Acidobacteria bacterium]|nr:transposase zinc-binding domain-containing protein [Acidobacteriota bacterium]
MDRGLSVPVSTVWQETPFAYDVFVADGEGLCVCEASAEYRPRNPEDNPLYGVVAGHLETFLARQRERDRPVPRFVERELRAFLDCGVLSRGFLRVHCDACGKDRVVPFSCRSYYTSCVQVAIFVQWSTPQLSGFSY